MKDGMKRRYEGEKTSSAIDEASISVKADAQMDSACRTFHQRRRPANPMLALSQQLDVVSVLLEYVCQYKVRIALTHMLHHS